MGSVMGNAAPRVTFLTQYFPPEMGAPQARISEFARGLADRGWEVSVVTALPNYPTGRVFEAYRGRMSALERMGPVTVRRTWIRPDATGRVSARLACAASFAASGLTACLLHIPKGGVLVAESPPLTLGPVGAIASRLRRRGYVLNVSDLWPSSLIEMGVLRDGWVARWAYAVEAASYRSALLITAQSPAIMENIQARFPERRVALLSNGVDTSLFRPELRSDEARRHVGAEGKVLVTYAGLHGLAQGLDAVIEAAHTLRNEPNLLFLLVGDGPEKASLVERASRLGLQNVRFMPPTDRRSVARLLASSDIALVTLRRPIRGAVPSKVYEAMASGVPVVAATEGGAAALVAETGAGLTVKPGDSAAIAAALLQLAGDADLRERCGLAGRRAACERYDRRIWLGKLSDYLASVLR